MGRGIAMCLANAGIPVRLKEAKQELLDSAMAAISGVYQSAVAKGRLTGAEKEHRLASVYPQLDFEGSEEVDLSDRGCFRGPRT